MEMDSIKTISISELLLELAKAITKEDYCPFYKSSPIAIPEKRYRAILVRKLKIKPPYEVSLYYFCNVGHECYQEKCPYSLVSKQRSLFLSNILSKLYQLEKF